ncbi:MAG: triose-phosphate isomerase [Flavobacteriaceae bacterium]
MRDQIVAGNWKMNNNQTETKNLIDALIQHSKPADVRIMVAPAFTQLAQATRMLDNDPINVAAQNMNAAPSGAHTGEVSAEMLKGVGVKTVILGHSERRALYHESDVELTEKVKAALEADLEIIFCFGEELADRKSGNHFKVVESQLIEVLWELPENAWNKIVLAYEPVWAIGTGETASPEQAQEMHAFIRNLIDQKFGSTLAQSVSILYGGSVKPANAEAIFSNKDVDGGLIGGASLNATDFMAIVNSF